MQLILNTVRKIDNDQTKELTFGDTQSLEEHLAIVFLNPKDMSTLKVSQDAHVKISNDDGAIVVKVLKDEDTPIGCAVLPVSIWANQLTQVHGSEIFYKNIKINVEATDEAITKYQNLINKIKGD